MEGKFAWWRTNAVVMAVAVVADPAQGAAAHAPEADAPAAIVALVPGAVVQEAVAHRVQG